MECDVPGHRFVLDTGKVDAMSARRDRVAPTPRAAPDVFLRRTVMVGALIWGTGITAMVALFL